MCVVCDIKYMSALKSKPGYFLKTESRFSYQILTITHNSHNYLTNYHIILILNYYNSQKILTIDNTFKKFLQSRTLHKFSEVEQFFYKPVIILALIVL